MQPQGELFERIINFRKRLESGGPVRMKPGFRSRRVTFRLLFLDGDPVFSTLRSSFVAHLRYPFEQCEFSLLCKPWRKSSKPVSTVCFDFDAEAWRVFVYDDNDYAILEERRVLAQAPRDLLAAIADRWRIINLDSLNLEIDQVVQPQLL